LEVKTDVQTQRFLMRRFLMLSSPWLRLPITECWKPFR